VIFNVNFKILSSLIKSAFVGIWTLYLHQMLSSAEEKIVVLDLSYFIENNGFRNMLITLFVAEGKFVKCSSVPAKWQTVQFIHIYRVFFFSRIWPISTGLNFCQRCILCRVQGRFNSRWQMTAVIITFRESTKNSLERLSVE